MENEDPWNPRPQDSGAEPQTPGEQPTQQAQEQPAPNWAFAPIDPSHQATQQQQATQQEATTGVWAPTPPASTGGGNGGGKARAGKVILAVIVLIAVSVGSGISGAAFEHHDNKNGSTVVAATPVSVSGGTTTSSQQLAKVAAAVQPSVVSITVTTSSAEDEGSGVILSSDGQILTNNHVVEAAASGTGGTIQVKFSDGKTASATIVGRDPSYDIAVIKATGVSGLTPATLGSTSSLHVGDTVLAIGSPLGLDGSVTSGIISALHRTVDLSSEEQQQQGQDDGGLGGLFGNGGSGSGGTGSQGRSQSSTAASTSVGDAIQTDAAINPGNSGGALVDINGNVVGINTAIASTGSTSGNIGVGFAIPIEEAKSVATDLIAGKTPQHALLGVEIDDQSQGAVVADVTSGGAADKAGIQTGDIITKVDSTEISDGTSLQAAVRAHQPNDQVQVTFTRNGTSKTVTVTLGAATS